MTLRQFADLIASSVLDAAHEDRHLREGPRLDRGEIDALEEHGVRDAVRDVIELA
jgi:hypothetical protein